MRRRRLFGEARGFESAFDSDAGVRAALILAYSDAVGGRFFANGDNTLTFDELHTFTRASIATHNDNTGLIVTVASGAHRLDHDKDGNRIGLLIEEARTNSCEFSEDISNWTPSVNPTIDLNTDIAPDGTMTADTLGDTQDNNLPRVVGNTITIADSEIVCASCFVKKDAIVKTTRFPALRCAFRGGTSSDLGCGFDTSTGEVQKFVFSGSATAIEAGVIDYGDYWRFFLVAQNDASSNTTVALTMFSAYGTNANLTSFNIAAQGEVAVWGFQGEVDGADFPSSYIPTTAAAVTRLGEDAPVATSKWDFSATVGSLYGVVTPNHLPTSELILFSLNDGTDQEVIEVYIDSSANVRFRVTDGGVDQCDIDSLVNAVAGTELKIAVSWAASDFAISVDGNTIAVDTGGTLPTVTTLDQCENGHTASLAQYKATLSDADLVARTV